MRTEEYLVLERFSSKNHDTEWQIVFQRLGIAAKLRHFRLFDINEAKIQRFTLIFEKSLSYIMVKC